MNKKRENGWTDRAQVLCGISRCPKEGLYEWTKFKNLPPLDFLLNSWKILKIHEIFCLILRTFFVLFYNEHVEIEDGREAP